MSVYIEHKQISLLYIQINVKIPSRVERTPSTSPQHIAETEFRIHKTKPNTFNLRRYPTLTQSLRRSGTRRPPSAGQPPRETKSCCKILHECNGITLTGYERFFFSFTCILLLSLSCYHFGVPVYDLLHNTLF